MYGLFCSNLDVIVNTCFYSGTVWYVHIFMTYAGLFQFQIVVVTPSIPVCEEICLCANIVNNVWQKHDDNVTRGDTRLPVLEHQK